MAENQEIRRSFDRSERVGVVGSPSSSNNLTIDILGTASDKKLVGSLCMFSFRQDGSDNYALGQITQIDLRNVWSEDPTMRGLIRQRGRVDPITERQDTHTATMVVSSVFAKNQKGFEASMLGTVPSTGTPVKVVSEEFMKDLLSEYSKELVYFGNAYGSTVPMTMWFKHFGIIDGWQHELEKMNQGKVGEPYHYPESFIQLLGYMRAYFHLPYRQT